MSTAVEAMLNLNTRSIHGLFLETIADAQAAGPRSVDGFVPVVVPCVRSVPSLNIARVLTERVLMHTSTKVWTRHLTT